MSAWVMCGPRLMPARQKLKPHPGTLAAREVLARQRRFERPTFAAGAFTHIASEQNKARCRLQAYRLFKTHARP